jgi:rubrerythrin
MVLPKLENEKWSCPKCGKAAKSKKFCPKCKVGEGYAEKVVGNILKK